MVPKIKSNKEKSFNVSNFSNGVNLRDGILNCLDNQFTEAKNVWHKNGILRTRPGFKPIDFENFEDDIVSDVFASVKNYPNITYVQDGETYFLSVIVCRNRLNFRFYSDKKMNVDDVINCALILPKDYGIINFTAVITDIDQIYDNEYTAKYITMTEVDRQTLLFYMYMYNKDTD